MLIKVDLFLCDDCVSEKLHVVNTLFELNTYSFKANVV